MSSRRDWHPRRARGTSAPFRPRGLGRAVRQSL